MKINTSILISLLFIIPGLISYFVASTSLPSLIAVIVGIFFLVTGLFETNNFRDKNMYLGIITVIIAISLIITYKQFTNLFHGNNLISALCSAAISLILIWIAYDFTKEWRIFKRKVISFNKLGLVVIILLMGLITYVQITI
ncbi:MAG TPA: hypothetical protein VK426_05090 [Methanobacterium sp.]|nr:hypothetical protein [Methanobacterium sp.]